MRAFRFQENYAEQWLHAARDKVIDGVERLTEPREVGRLEYLGMFISVKVRCLGAILIAIVATIGSFFRALGLTISSYLLHRASDLQVQEAWDDTQEAIDLILSGFSAFFDSESVLSASDRGNVRRVYTLGRKLQDLDAMPNINPKTKKELETWYKNAKVFIRKGGHEAKAEMTSLAAVLEHINMMPDADPDKLMSYRWEQKVTSSVELEKIRGIRWQEPEKTREAESLTKRTWTKKKSY